MDPEQVIQEFIDALTQGYLGTLGAWVQVAPPRTTRLNAFNTLGDQHIMLAMFDQNGIPTGRRWDGRLEAGKALRLDLADLLSDDDLPFEGCIWAACKGDDSPSNLGIQAIDLDFVDTSRVEGHVLGTVHLMQDFFNTLGLPPWLDLISPRLMVGYDEAGAPRWTNFLGLAHHPVTSGQPARVQVRVANTDGEWLDAPEPLVVPLFGSRFVSIESLIPGLDEHLGVQGTQPAFGAINVREVTPAGQIGLCAMLKVTDNETGDFLVDHLNDRHFAKPTQKG